MKKKDTNSTKVILVLSLLLTIACVAMVTHVLKNDYATKNSDSTIVCDLPDGKKSEENFSLDAEQEVQQNRHHWHHVYNLWNDHTSDIHLGHVKSILDKKLENGKERAEYVLSITNDGVIVMVAMKPGWKRGCHRHPVNFQMQLIEGRFFVKTHETKKPVFLEPGDQFFIPKWQPHKEGIAGRHTAYAINILSPNVNPSNLTEYLNDAECSYKSFPSLQIPKITTNEKPMKRLLPEHWSATVLLHPFSEEQGIGPERDFPFFQLSYGQVSYNFPDQIMLIYVKGCTSGEWWFKLFGNHTTVVSQDSTKWKEVDLGWSFPSRNWTDAEDLYIGHSQLNWMSDEPRVDWWKKNYRNTSTWSWFDRSKDGVPFRLMFSAPPSTNIKGEADNLAFFQMYAFSYIVNVKSNFTEIDKLHLVDNDVGFTCGNPDNYSLFNWTNHFSMSAFMIPVDFPHNPYPTRVYYRWNEKENYTGNPFDRCQSTIFYNDYNGFEKLETVRADLFGHWDGKEKRNGIGLLSKTSLTDWQTSCEKMFDGDIPIAQQPPWWPTLGRGKVVAIIRKPITGGSDWRSPLTNSNRTIAIIRVTFPPHEPNFPNSTSLWTWYDYTDHLKGVDEPRPVTFMQSAPKFNLGTSLALADFFDFKVLSENVTTRTKFDLENLKLFCNFS